MCGIVAKLDFRPGVEVTRAEIERMLRPIRHRGPDGDGVHLDGAAGLGHVRLSIIDVAGGAQPMANEDETIWVVYNGEVYNFKALRADLIQRGHVFRTHSDTEVIVHLYEEHGTACVEHLRGMFTFALWDHRAKRMLVARDRVGIKPLYYAKTRDALLVGSELKALLADPGVGREINPEAIRQFLSFYYLPGEQTLFRTISKLPPGHILVADHNGCTVRRYWDLRFSRSRYEQSFEDSVDELHALLRQTVRDHMIADVPVGVLLSGGVDSSAVLSFAAEAAGERVKAFTIGFAGDDVVDERPYARLAARKFGAEHHELTITPDEFWDFLPRYVWHMEEPVCEPPAVALYYVSRLAREHVKVVLSGEGGDEAFGGYPNYPHMLSLARIERLLGPLARPTGASLESAAAALRLPRVHRYAHMLGRPLAETYFSRTASPTTFFNGHGRDLFTADFQAATASVDPAAFMARVLAPVRRAPLLDQLLYADTKTWLPDDLLVKADKMTMANSLELRVPLLDHRVLEFAASLNPQHKVAGSATKRVLKAAFARQLPAEVLTRKKAGFPIPFNTWLRGVLAPRVRELLLENRPVSAGYIERRAVERLLQAHERTGGHAREVFALIVMELFDRQFCRVPAAPALVLSSVV